MPIFRWAKSNVENAVNHIGRFEHVLSAEAARHHAQGVICGHIHHVVMHDDFDVRYINTGDWVEACSGVVEHYDGRFEITRWARPQPHHAVIETVPSLSRRQPRNPLAGGDRRLASAGQSCGALA